MRDALEDLAFQIASAVQAYAAVTGNEVLAAKVLATPTSLGGLTDSVLDDAAERIHTAADDHIGNLADYGVTPADATQPRARITRRRAVRRRR